MPGNAYGQDTYCYNCMPGGDTRRRSRRSAGEGRFIEKHDSNGRASVNTSFPIELHIDAASTDHHTPLLNLQPSMKQLRGHAKYQIVSGNDGKRFRMHHRDETSFLHFSKLATDEEDHPIVEVTEHNLRIRAFTTLSKEEIRELSLDSDVIEKAIESEVELDVKIYVEN